ncbi:MAG TPA: hypothetical protein VHA53_13280, partial [Nitrolancea sp.]|nr:hypothetical protein [Nitrolancea sp.]
GVSYADLSAALAAAGLDPTPLSEWQLAPDLAFRVEVDARYSGYIQKELRQVARAQRLEHRAIPRGVDYAGLPSLRAEAREKLASFRPATLGQASRIAGVTPGDIAVLMVHLERISGNAVVT